MRIIAFDELKLIISLSQGLTQSTASLVLIIKQTIYKNLDRKINFDI